MDAREQPPVAPGRAVRRCARGARRPRPRARSRSGSSSRSTKIGPERLQAPAQDRLRIARRLGREPAVALEHDAAGRARARRATRCQAPRLRRRRRSPSRAAPRGPPRRSRAAGQASSRTRAIASGSSAPSSSAVFGVERAAREHGLRAALLERRVVEERVRLRGEDPARERRRLGRVDRDALDRAVAQPAQHLEEPVDVHRLGQAVLDRLAHDRVVHRDLDRPARAASPGTRATCGKRAREQVVGAHAQERRRHALAAARALEQQRALRVPAPARLEHRRGEQRLDRGRRARSSGAGSRRPPRAGSCAAARARARSPPRSPRPAARSRSRRRTACAARAPRRG